ncbi:flippase [Streptococcus sp. NLN64]|uniref:flippase n=1 Tax=Streptococcus sp. NLN64 TaxID=2822799 RepID=UPI0018C91550|nr:flippase [Streptococcus sp. NLN64]MBG9367203.1 flippase [Streptococcus sp. NLN64]
MKKNLGINAFLNLVKTSLSILFPLLTYPHVSRVLGVENIGKINYTGSLVSYFSLIAALGISTYAIREGSKIRTDKAHLQKLGNELFTINILSTLLSYLLLAIVVFLFIENPEYKILIFVQSLSIFFTTLGVDWINVIFEDYLFITARSLLIQFASLIWIFGMIKSPQDLYLYAAITVITSGITCLLNLWYCRKYLKLRLTWNPNVSKHIRSIMTFFSGGLAISLYVNSDTLILEWMKGPYYVGLYTIAVKVYSILKTLMASVYSVTIPKLSSLYAEGRIEEFKQTYTKILNYVTLLLLPLTAGMIVLSKEIILFMGGKAFVASTLTLQLLAVSLIGAIFGGVLTYALNIPIGREAVNFHGSVFAIIINIVLSLILIPALFQNGAAISTIASEFFIVAYNFFVVKESSSYIDFSKWKTNLRDAFIGSLLIIGLGMIFSYFGMGSIMYSILLVLSSILVYIIVLIFFKNKELEELFGQLKRRLS